MKSYHERISLNISRKPYKQHIIHETLQGQNEKIVMQNF